MKSIRTKSLALKTSTQTLRRNIRWFNYSHSGTRRVDEGLKAYWDDTLEACENTLEFVIESRVSGCSLVRGEELYKNVVLTCRGVRAEFRALKRTHDLSARRLIGVGYLVGFTHECN